MLPFFQSLVISVLASVQLFIYLKKHFIANEPCLKERPTDALFVLPSLHLLGATFLPIFMLLFLPEKYNILAYLNSEMARQNIPEEMYELMYSTRTSSYISAVFCIAAIVLEVYVMEKRTKQSREMKQLALGVTLFSGFLLMGGLMLCVVIFLNDPSSNALPIGLIASLVTVAAVLWVAQRKFNKAVDLLYRNTEAAPRSVASEEITAETIRKDSSAPAPGEPQMSNRTQQLFQLKELLDSGILTQAEFDVEKKKILNY